VSRAALVQYYWSATLNGSPRERSDKEHPSYSSSTLPPPPSPNSTDPCSPSSKSPLRGRASHRPRNRVAEILTVSRSGSLTPGPCVRRPNGELGRASGPWAAPTQSPIRSAPPPARGLFAPFAARQRWAGIVATAPVRHGYRAASAGHLDRQLDAGGGLTLEN